MKTRGEIMCSGRIFFTCSACGTRHDIPNVESRNETYSWQQYHGLQMSLAIETNNVSDDYFIVTVSMCANIHVSSEYVSLYQIRLPILFFILFCTKYYPHIFIIYIYTLYIRNSCLSCNI